MEKTKKVPVLRFPGFEGEWKIKRLDDITIKVGSGSTPLGGQDVYQNHGVIFIRSQNVNDDRLILDDVVFIPEKVHNTMKGSSVHPSDILLNITGASLGRSCVVPESFLEGNVNQHVCIIRLNTDNDPVFLQRLLTSSRGQRLMIEAQTGSGREGLNFQSIRRFKIKRPSLPEQQKIASFLSSVDEKIQKLQKKKELLEQYKKGVMQKIFNQEIRFKDEDGKEFPEWEISALSEIGTTYNGLTGKSGEDFGGGLPYITYKQIFDASVIETSKFGFVKLAPNERQNKVAFGDVLFTISSETPKEIGYASVLLEDVPDLYLNSFCFGFRIMSFEVMSPLFARYLFRSPLFRQNIIKLAQGSTRYNMSKSALMKLKIEIPLLQEQIKIANFLSSTDDKITRVNKQLNQTKQFKKGLLQQMFV